MKTTREQRRARRAQRSQRRRERPQGFLPPAPRFQLRNLQPFQLSRYVDLCDLQRDGGLQPAEVSELIDLMEAAR